MWPQMLFISKTVLLQMTLDVVVLFPVFTVNIMYQETKDKQAIFFLFFKFSFALDNQTGCDIFFFGVWPIDYSVLVSLHKQLCCSSCGKHKTP